MTSHTLESEQPETPPPQPTGLAYAGHQARLSEARQRLLEDVIEFLRRMKNRGELEIGRNPFSEDLIPYFLRYAGTVIEARYREEIVHAASLSEARTLIRNAVDMVVKAICKRSEIAAGTRKSSGVWFLTIKQACSAVNFNICMTDYGTYDQTAFSYRPQMQMRALLLVKARELETEFWKRKAIDDRSAPTADPIVPLDDFIAQAPDPTRAEPAETSDAKGHFPVRAKWLEDRLRERGWSPQEFYNHRGPDRGTTRRIRKGLPVRAMTLDKVAEGLSKKHSNVSPSDIPNC